MAWLIETIYRIEILVPFWLSSDLSHFPDTKIDLFRCIFISVGVVVLLTQEEEIEIFRFSLPFSFSNMIKQIKTRSRNLVKLYILHPPNFECLEKFVLIKTNMRLEEGIRALTGSVKVINSTH